MVAGSEFCEKRTPEKYYCIVIEKGIAAFSKGQ